jgi:hypothetical protein
LEHRHGYELHVVWGHELKERLRAEPHLRQLWEGPVTDQVVRPLDPREDALRGGRTEPFVLHHVCAEDEEIICIDIVSSACIPLFCMQMFPLGQPLPLCDEGQAISGWQPPSADP